MARKLNIMENGVALSGNLHIYVGVKERQGCYTGNIKGKQPQEKTVMEGG